MIEESELAPEYVAARTVLLDALAALKTHLDNLILVGAQAVYHHTGSADLVVAPMTTDADLAINVQGLAGSPEIGSLLRQSGFTPGPNPGHWVAVSSVAIDLMMVPHQAGISRSSARAARISPHERLTARIAHGLEPALVDNETVTLSSFQPADTRTFSLRVAGPAALLTAKIIKISERLEQADQQASRLKEKDALDVFRLLQAIEASELRCGFDRHAEDQHAAAATAEAVDFLRKEAMSPHSRLPRLAALAMYGEPSVAPAFAALVNELLDAS